MNPRKLTVLLIGSGGREHALAWKISQSARLGKLIIAPGSDAMPGECWKISLNKENFEECALLAVKNKIDLCVIGPDNPLADGISDVFHKHGIACFGPSQAAARIESSKSFSKEVMQAAGVPTARFSVFDCKKDAIQFLKSQSWQNEGWVIKADGLALGKGVVVCDSLDESLDALNRLIQISGKVIIEEKLLGKELSWMAFTDGTDVRLLEPARDYKPLLENNLGPNTGGMGSYSPVAEVLGFEFKERVKKEIFLPTLREMKKRGCPFVGLLYAGLMFNEKTNQLSTLEFNARFGDPETQVLMPRMESDFLDYAEACVYHRLSDLPEIQFKNESAVYVVAASQGYPSSSQKGIKIDGNLVSSAWSSDVDYFCAAVKKENSHWVTSGGRVFGALGLAETQQKARELAYQKLSKVTFPGMQFRKDIAL